MRFFRAGAVVLSCLITSAFAPAAFAWGSSSKPKYATLTETVPYTGRTHLVLIYDYGVFPAETYAALGDRILFVNKSSDDVELKASNSGWQTGDLDHEEGYLLLVQSGVDKTYKNSSQTCGRYSCSYTHNGKFTIQAAPAPVNYWTSAMSVSELLSAHDVSGTLWQSVLTSFAAVQKAAGVVKRVTG